MQLSALDFTSARPLFAGWNMASAAGEQGAGVGEQPRGGFADTQHKYHALGGVVEQGRVGARLRARQGGQDRADRAAAAGQATRARG